MRVLALHLLFLEGFTDCICAGFGTAGTYRDLICRAIAVAIVIYAVVNVT
jgi:hypothetical protein